MAKEPMARRLRVYEQWQGNEHFFCWGRCVAGPSWKSGMGTLALLIAPTVVFLVFVAPYMSARVTPAILVISCIFPVFCASMLLLTSCRDPGILPRQEPDEEWLQGRKPRARDVAVNGHRVTVRYNDTCHFYQPPRAHHCSVNDNCIERFDHHCPWVGTTIGKRNYRTFLLFIYSTSLYIAWTFGVCLGSLFVKHKELVQAAGPSSDNIMNNLWLQTLGQSGAAIALMIFTFIFFWFVCGLSGFHTWLVATNQTTYENFRYNHNQVPNPYSEGVFRNCASIWCVRIPPSKVQFRAFIDEVKRAPVELGYPEWNPAATVSPLRSGPSVADGVAIEMQDTQNDFSMSPGRFSGMSREPLPPAQSYDSGTTDSAAQAPMGLTNSHSILGGDVAQPPQQQQPSWSMHPGGSRHANPPLGYSDGYNNGQPQQLGNAPGSPVGSSGTVGYQQGPEQGLPVSATARAGSLGGAVQAMRAAGPAAVSGPRQAAYIAAAAAPEQQGYSASDYHPLGGSGAAVEPRVNSSASLVAPEHVAIHMPAEGVSSSSSRHLQEQQPASLSDSAVAAAGRLGNPSVQQPAAQYAAQPATNQLQRTATEYHDANAGDLHVSGAESTATEYHDARRSQASWDSTETPESEHGGARGL